MVKAVPEEVVPRPPGKWASRQTCGWAEASHQRWMKSNGWVALKFTWQVWHNWTQQYFHLIRKQCFYSFDRHLWDCVLLLCTPGRLGKQANMDHFPELIRYPTRGGLAALGVCLWYQEFELESRSIYKQRPLYRLSLPGFFVNIVDLCRFNGTLLVRIQCPLDIAIYSDLKPSLTPFLCPTFMPS